MSDAVLKKIRGLVLRRIENRQWRRRIARFSARIVKIVGAITLISAFVTFVATGGDFFMKTIPHLFTAASRTVLLAGTFRPLLADYIVANDLKYEGQCVSETRVIDLDLDGAATDLIISISPKQEIDKVSSCPSEIDYGSAVHLILKELPWRGWRPQYSLLHAFSMGVPTIFDTSGPFLIAITAARLNPGYHIYAYGSGGLHFFGSFRSLADDSPQLQLGRRLYIRAIDGFRSFELTASGEPRMEFMTARDVVARNNTVIVLEDEVRWSDEEKSAIKKAPKSSDWMAFDYYDRTAAPDEKCKDFAVFENGRPLQFKVRAPQTSKSIDEDAVCSAEVRVNSTSQIVSNMSCSFDGFVQSPQFPW